MMSCLPRLELGIRAVERMGWGKTGGRVRWVRWVRRWGCGLLETCCEGGCGGEGKWMDGWMDGVVGARARARRLLGAMIGGVWMMGDDLEGCWMS